jgi:5'-nucleotidase
MKQFSAEKSSSKHHDAATGDAISYARSQWAPTHSPVTFPGMKWVQATTKALLAFQTHSARHIGDALRIGGREHMSVVDPFDGKGARAGERCKIPGNSSKQMEDPGDPVRVHPVIDGRMFDIARRK